MLPVFSASGVVSIQCGIISPTKIAVPMIARFLDELSETPCRFDKTTPLNIPNIIIMEPPRTGYGIVTKAAANLPTIPKIILMHPTPINTSRLAT